MNCRECFCEMVPQRAWSKADPMQRHTWLKAGIRKLQARGLCANCYMRHHVRGEYPKRTSAGKNAPHPCVRCGITTVNKMCRDCEEVEAA